MIAGGLAPAKVLVLASIFLDKASHLGKHLDWQRHRLVLAQVGRLSI